LIEDFEIKMSNTTMSKTTGNPIFGKFCIILII